MGLIVKCRILVFFDNGGIFYWRFILIFLQKVRTDPKGTVLIEGLQSHVTSDDIKEIFERTGTVTQAFVNYDTTGKSTGTASVVYARRADARQAQRELNGAKIDNKPVRVKLASSPMYVITFICFLVFYLFSQIIIL